MRPFLLSTLPILLCISGGCDGGTCKNERLFSVAHPYNAFVLDDFTSGSSDVEGRIAVGGNLFIWSYSIGLLDSGESVVGADASLTDASLYGDLAHAGTLSLLRATVSGTSHVATPIDFVAARTNLETLSGRLAAESSTGTTTLLAGELQFTGTSPTRNVFSASAAQLDAAWGVRVTVPAGSTAIINISGASVIATSAGFEIGSAAPEEILLNFHEATNIRFEAIGIQGTVLAPFAAVDFDNGQQNGQLIAAEFAGDGSDDRQSDGQLNHHPFAGDLCPP
jgi:choice-of-anchor A domain-containing protein